MTQSPRNGRLAVPAFGGLLAAMLLLTSCGRDITSPSAPELAVLNGSVQADKGGDKEKDKKKDEKFTLSVDLAGNGNGMVKSSPKEIACGGKAERGHDDDHGDKGKKEEHDDKGENCHESFAPGAVVTLTARALGRSVFVGWTGPCAESDLTGATCTVTMDADKSVTATFSKNVSYALDVAISAGIGAVSSSPAGIDCGATCNASFPSGTEVTLTAQPDIGLVTTWTTGDCDSNPTPDTCVVTMSGPKSVTVTFAPPPPTGDSFVLEVAIVGGSGTVTWTPSAGTGGSLSAPGTLGSSTLAAGTTVTFTLTGSTTTILGCTSVVGGVCTQTMDQAYQVAVIFDSAGNALIIQPATPPPPPPPVCDPLAGPCPPQVR